ncbi:hypothetical protein KKH05_00055 [Patescibacteria group bacterium]|nr:hypothetical protein [Patescibacteria group bacterium]
MQINMLIRNIVIAVLVLLVVVAVLFIVSNKDGDRSAEETSLAKDLSSVEVLENGNLLIKYPEINASVVVPAEWDVRVLEGSTNGVAGNYRRQETSAYFHLYYEPEKVVPSIEDFEKENENCRASMEGDRLVHYCQTINGTYDAPLGSEYASLNKDSYMIGSLISYQGGVVSIQCQVNGLEYARYISACTDIVESLQIK